MILLKISSNLCFFFFELENMIFDRYGGIFWVKKRPEFSKFQEIIIIIINCQISIFISSR